MKTNSINMKAIITTCICMLLSMSLLKPVIAQDNSAKGLEGKTFTIQMEDRANPGQAKTDILVFKDRVFDSQNLRQHGFTPTGYILKPGGSMGDYFQVVATSDKEGTMTWQGYVKDNIIEGGLIVEKPGQAATKYPFKGILTSGDKVNNPTPADKQMK